MAAKKRGGLGRGLEALFADVAPVQETVPQEDPQPAQEPAAAQESSAETDRVLYVDINDIKPNPEQPRKNFDPEKLEELARSIEENGVIQPLVVRKVPNGYELVAGERRWRASRLAGLRTVPCIVREFDEKQKLIVAILENMQREDLDPIEEAEGLQQMSERFGFTQEQVSASVGKSRAYIANSVRLLKLPEEIREMIRDGRLSAAHGRTLVSLGNERQQKAVADRIVREGLSVRATEKLADSLKKGREPRPAVKAPEDPDVLAVEEELRTILGTKVRIVQQKRSGRIELEYYSREELNRLIDLLRSL
ncbi:MAG: ParB/RepB/Spo0J family partition protein [Mogibacterium sp.]|nr:ParB/RepB/Spo0J family partition protein [Mogibacterium sp.]